MGLRSWHRRLEESAGRRPVAVGLLSGFATYPLLVLVLSWARAPGNPWLVALAGSLVLGLKVALMNVDLRDMRAEYEASREATIRARRRR